MSLQSNGGGRSGIAVEKLRKACNQCNQAKVRCTGQRSGCDRCRALEASCVYEESRVGKVPGVRARKNKQQQLTPQRRPQHVPQHPSQRQQRLEHERPGSSPAPWSLEQSAAPHAEHSTVSASPANAWPRMLATPPSGAANTLLLDDNFLDGSFELEEHAPGSEPNRSEANCSRDSRGASDSGLDMNHFDLDTSSFASPTYTSVTNRSLHDSRGVCTPPSTVSYQDPVPVRQPWSAERDSQCVATCCHIMMTLERYIEEEVSALDLVLGSISSSTEAVSQLLELQRESYSPRCFFLLLAIMDQITSILARACEALTSNRQSSGGPSAISGLESGPRRSSVGVIGGSILAFGFANFQAEAAEQRAIRAGATLKKIFQVQQVYRRVVELGKIQRLSSGEANYQGLEAVVERLSRHLKPNEGLWTDFPK